jgi:hypothetical protein
MKPSGWVCGLDLGEHPLRLGPGLVGDDEDIELAWTWS